VFERTDLQALDPRVNVVIETDRFGLQGCLIQSSRTGT
jgi:hypothetical protein